MTTKCLKYKGFVGSIECSIEDGVLHGKLECINDLVTYEATNVPELEAAFKESVDDYLETCAMLKIEPDKTMSGTFNVRIGPELHKKIYLKAKESGSSLNDFVKETLEAGLKDKTEVHHVIHTQPEASTNTYKNFAFKKPDQLWSTGSGIKLKDELGSVIPHFSEH